MRESRIRLVGVRHEQAAGYAADGYARATGKLGVALVTTGPGAANTLGAVGEAWASRSPILVIATDIPAALRRPDTYRGILHETTDQAAMFAPVVKATFVCGRRRLRRAAAARGRARPSPRRPAPPTCRSRPTCSAAEVGAADPAPRAPAPERHRRAPSWRGAERPLMWAGSGAVDAGRRGHGARRAARRAGDHHLRRGRDAPARHPCAVGMPPHVEPVGRLWDEADLVISVGSDLDGVQTQNFAHAAAAAPGRHQPRRRRTRRRTTAPTP